MVVNFTVYISADIYVFFLLICNLCSILSQQIIFPKIFVSIYYFLVVTANNSVVACLCMSSIFFCIAVCIL